MTATGPKRKTSVGAKWSFGRPVFWMFLEERLRLRRSVAFPPAPLDFL